MKQLRDLFLEDQAIAILTFDAERGRIVQWTR